tara:strand:+ start:7666 stop:9141 length:1476 start_codon:yes stop_codon:yes gene_type:complete
MAVTFNPIGGSSLTIGGTSGTGPFPKYSINVERVESGDGTLIDLIYNISVTGQIIATGDITTPGARQNNLMSQMIAKLALTENEVPIGRLEIVSYGGLADDLTFNDAVLTGIEYADQDDSGSVQYQDYTFTFTAHKRDGTKIGNSHSLSTAEETWEIAENSERTFENSDLSVTPLKTFTITHTVNATGYIKSLDNTYQKSAWSEAKDWVLSRLVDNPDETIANDMADKSRFTDFIPIYMGANSDDFIDLGTEEYYNHNRVATSDLSGGSYSVTETWFVSKESVTHDVEINYDLNEEQVASVVVNGTISGLSTSSFESKEENKITQAEAVLNTVLGQAYTLASGFYDTVKESGANGLTNNVLSKSVAKSPVAGTITYTVNFSDKEKENDDTITETLTVTDDNEDRSVQTVAIIAIIGKADGPIFQDMGTTPERKRSVAIDWTMKKDKRDEKPSAAALTAANTYKPTGAYQLSKTESWTKATGAYTLNIEWSY